MGYTLIYRKVTQQSPDRFGVPGHEKVHMLVKALMPSVTHPINDAQKLKILRLFEVSMDFEKMPIKNPQSIPRKYLPGKFKKVKAHHSKYHGEEYAKRLVYLVHDSDFSKIDVMYF